MTSTPFTDNASTAMKRTIIIRKDGRTFNASSIILAVNTFYNQHRNLKLLHVYV